MSGYGGYSSGGGYGGYMGNTTASNFNSKPMFSGMDHGNSSVNHSPAAPFGSPSGKKNNDPSMRHVTIKQVFDAKELIPDSPCVLDGRPLGSVYLIGRVNKVQEQSTHVKYTIDDGTGTMEVSKWADNKGEMEADDEVASREAFSEGVYIRVIGALRLFQGKRTIMAHHISLVDQMDQVTYHNLMAMYTQMYLSRGGMGGFQQRMAAMSSGGLTLPGTTNSMLYNSTTHNSMLPAQPSMYTPLQDQVLQTIRALDNGTHLDGVKFQDVSFKLRGVSSELDIRAALDTLLNDSVIYTTSDDDTFKLS